MIQTTEAKPAAKVNPLDHQGLVGMIARRYLGRGLEFEDLLAEGQIGLLVAVERFNANLGWKFTTYAQWWIRQSIARAVRNQRGPLRLPEYLQNAIASGQTPDDPEIGEGRRRCLTAAFQVLDSDGGQLAEDVSLADLAIDETPVVDEYAATKERLELLNNLPERHSAVLRMRFGLEPYAPHTLAETGRKLGITKERVRQIEAAALHTLREMTRAQEASLT